MRRRGRLLARVNLIRGGSPGLEPSFAACPADDGFHRWIVNQRRNSRQLACARATASGPAGKRKRSVSS